MAWLLAIVVPGALQAAPVAVDSARQYASCLASGDIARTPEQIVAAKGWNCAAPRYSLKPERNVLRFELDHTRTLPRYLVTRRSPYESLRIDAVDFDGTRRTLSYTPETARPSAVNGFFHAGLPPVTDQTREVIVTLDRPTHAMTMEQAHLSPNDPGEHPSVQPLLTMLAALSGMLLMPVLFNAAFYRVLREPFVLWHAALTVTLMLTIFFNSGLSVILVDLSNSQLSKLTTLAFGTSVAAGGMFAYSFIEPGKMNPRLRRLLPMAAIWSLALSMFHAFFPFVGRAWQTDAYYAAFLPVLLLYIAAVANSLRLGSRAAKFQLVGWTPLLFVGVTRLVSQFVDALPATDAMMLFYVGCVFEVIATTLGVTDRFMLLKHQRDRARTEAQMLEHMTEHDSLTGLYNRRLLEDRFPELRNQGYSVFALLDIDRFKTINDTFGHSVGDDVLRAVALALQEDGDALAVRMGGEEFALLLRGQDAVKRVERLRLAIPRHVSASVEIDRIVTASMGVCDIPMDVLPAVELETIFRHADRLLYEAKAAGRNRMVSEKVGRFPAPTERRSAFRNKAVEAA
ncbi:sensor domain-containing diguanylate cyclase [Alteraurantiacibacter aquimixticola]|nr:diguanylate cyclase [Alteraurantiacibacter aquimixticola]